MNQTRPIVELGDPRLREVAKMVERSLDEAVINIISDMTATLASTCGVGIAAPQIGECYQIIIVSSRPTARYPMAPPMSPIVMINPTFNSTTERREKDWEGCLSIPGIRALVPRYTDIEVNYQDTQSVFKTINFSGFVARVFQHEFDHLHGQVYLDRVESSLDIISENMFQKLYVEKKQL